MRHSLQYCTLLLCFLAFGEFVRAQTIPTKVIILNGRLGSPRIGFDSLPAGSSTSPDTSYTSDRPVHAANSITYGYTGSVQTFTVPACVTSLTIDMAGAAGGAGFASRNSGIGGAGARIQATLAVVAGQVINIYVGGTGSSASSSTSGGAGGYGGNGDENGGSGYGSATTSWSLATGYGAGGGGGGATVIRLPAATAFANDILSAAGGGGVGMDGAGFRGNRGVAGGNGGGGQAAPSMGSASWAVAEEGNVGSAGAAGASTNWACGTSIASTVGTQGNGGNGGMEDGATDVCGNYSGGGGGGGGHYGGGGGCGGGGGGGYSYYAGAGVSAVTQTAGYEPGNGYCTITWNSIITATITASTNPTGCATVNGSATASGAGGTGPYSYSWAPAGYTGGATATYSNLPAGTYTCTVTDANGCSNTVSVTLISPGGTNDNFACATALPIYTTCPPTFTAGTCNAATLQANELTDCQNYNKLDNGSIVTVWYSFTVTAATGSGPFFINLFDQSGHISGGVREYYHGLSVWDVTQLPASTCAGCPCAPIQCMDNEDIGYENWVALRSGCGTNSVQQTQPNFTQYSTALNNLPNGTYYIQVGYPKAAQADAFQLSVSTCLPAGYTLTNPLSITGQGQSSAGGTCLPLGAGQPCSSAAECPLSSNYISLTTGNVYCSTGGNINSCEACPAGNDNTSADCVPCMTAVINNGGGLTTSSSSATYPAGFYPDPTSDIGTSTVTYQSLATSYNGETLTPGSGVVGPGYDYQYCYSFISNSTSTQNVINLQNYFPNVFGYDGCFGGYAGTVYWADWALYNANMSSLLACGNISSLSVGGIGCSTEYVMCFSAQYVFEVYTDMTTTEPYTSFPWVGQTDCNPTLALCTSALPITLSSFQVSYEQTNNSVTIYWSTASESDNKLFTVQKSIDGVNWQTVTTVAGAGNSSQTLFYSAVDENPWSGLSYYRLMQTDFDGKFTYSRIATVVVPADYTAHVFPNPTSGNMTLRYGSSSPDPLSIRITDISGTPIASYTIDQVTKGTNDYTVYTAGLASGMYIMQVSNYQKTFYLKFVKQ